MYRFWNRHRFSYVPARLMGGAPVVNYLLLNQNTRSALGSGLKHGDDTVYFSAVAFNFVQWCFVWWLSPEETPSTFDRFCRNRCRSRRLFAWLFSERRHQRKQRGKLVGRRLARKSKKGHRSRGGLQQIQTNSSNSRTGRQSKVICFKYTLFFIECVLAEKQDIVIQCDSPVFCWILID